MKFKTVPRSHQLEALRAGWNKVFFAYLMGRGTGKTKVALDNAALLFDKGLINAVLIIAPNGVHKRWITEQIPIHMPVPVCIWPDHKENALLIASINIEALQYQKGKDFSRKFCKKYETMVIMDESTRIKTPGAKQTRNTVYLGKLAKYRRILTGNEVTNTPFDVYSQFRFLNNNFWSPIKNFKQFKEYYGVWTKKYARKKQCKNKTRCSKCGKIIRPLVIPGISFKCPICGGLINLATPEARKIKEEKGLYKYPYLIKYRRLEHMRKRINDYSFRARKRDCLDLPEKIYSPIYTEMNKKQSDVYNELKNDLLAEYQGQTLSIQNKISMSLRFQQIVGGFFPTDDGDLIYLGSPKLDALLYDLEEDHSVIIWACFVAELKLIARTLSKKYPNDRVELFFGETKNRKRIIDDFQQGKIRFLVANPAVGGVGLNLQKSNLHYYYSNSHKPEPRWQSEDRSHRDGQHWPVVYKDIFIKNSIDDNVKKSLETKKALAEFFKLEDL